MPKKKCKYLVIFIAFIFLINIGGVEAAGFSDDNIINICGFYNVPARLPKITSTLYNLAKLLTPIVLIVMGMIDFTNAVMQGDEQKQKKSTKKFINRFIAAVLIFLVMAIVQFVFRTVDSSNNTNFLNCMNCVLSNDNCGSSKSGKPTSSGSNSGSSGSGNAAVSLITKTANKVASFALKALNKKGITTCDYCANESTDSQITCINQCIQDNDIKLEDTDEYHINNSSSSSASATDAYNNAFDNNSTDSTQSSGSKPFSTTKCSQCSHISDSNVYSTCQKNCIQDKSTLPIT